MNDIDRAFKTARNSRPRSREVWRQRQTMPTVASNLSNCLGFSSLSVCTRQLPGRYIGGIGDFFQFMSRHVEVAHHPLGIADRSDCWTGLFGLAAIPG